MEQFTPPSLWRSLTRKSPDSLLSSATQKGLKVTSNSCSPANSHNGSLMSTKLWEPDPDPFLSLSSFYGVLAWPLVLSPTKPQSPSSPGNQNVSDILKNWHSCLCSYQPISKKRLFLFLLCSMCICLFISVCTTCLPGALGGQMGMLDV